jgi:hypothetical protein
LAGEGVKLPEALRDWPWRDSHGRPVPHVNVWSAEKPDTSWIVRYDPVVADLAVQAPSGLQGIGAPDFTKQEPRRARWCTVRRRCQVCTAPVGDDGLLVVASLSLERVYVDELGTECDVVTEPWLCEPCARFALAVCPGLIRRAREEALKLVRPKRTVVILSRGWLEGPMAKQTQRQQPVMWAKLAVGQGYEVVADVGS